MKILLSSDEVNLLVYRYLVENGFIHAAYAFFNEANISKNSYYISHDEKLPCHALVTFMQKALVFIFIEYHTEHNNGRISCKEPFSLFKRHECFAEENDLSEEQENKIGIRENEKNNSNNLNTCSASSKAFGNNNVNRTNLSNSVSFSDLKNDSSLNNVDGHGPSGANAKKNPVSKKNGGKIDNEEADGKTNQDNKKNMNQVSNGNGKDTNNNCSSNNTNDSNAPKAKTNSKPSIYSSSFSNFASLNYNDSNISFKDIKRNYANIFAQGKKSKKSSSNKKNNSTNTGGSNNVSNRSNNKNSETDSGHNNSGGGNSKKNDSSVSSNRSEGKAPNVKNESDDVGPSGNQRKKSKVMKIVSKSNKENEDENGKCNNMSDSILSDDKGKEHNHVSDTKEDNVEGTKHNGAKKYNNLNNNIKKNNVNTSSSGKGASLSNNNNANGKKKELSGGNAGQNNNSSNKKKKKVKKKKKESTSSNSTNNSKKTIKSSLQKEKNEKGNKSVTSKQKKNDRQDSDDEEEDEDCDDEVSDENSEEDSEFSNDNEGYNNENDCNAPMEDSANNSAQGRDNPSSSSINNNATVDDKSNDDTYANFKKNSGTNIISNNHSHNSTIDGVKNENSNPHIIMTHYDGFPNNAYDGNLQEDALAKEKSLNGNNSKYATMLKGEFGEQPPAEVEGIEENNNSSKSEFNFSFTNFLNKKISSIFNNTSGNDDLIEKKHNNDCNDSTVKDASNNEQVLPQDAQDPPTSEAYESVSSSKHSYNKFSQKGKLIKDEYMEAKYEKEHLAKEQRNEAKDVAGEVGAPAKKQKRPYDYNSDMKVQEGGDTQQMEEDENDKICVEEKKRKKSSIYEENYKNEMNKEFFKKLTQTSANKGDSKCEEGSGSLDMKEESEDDELGRGVEKQGMDNELERPQNGDLHHCGNDGNEELAKAKICEQNKISINNSDKNYYNRSPSTAHGDDHESYDKMDENYHGEGNFLKTN
ncbi:conserved Plasmodium protein, unknown function [Plasmodium knowlesi strain H]|uniref:Uncharacterized protein n=3 Tax=Plasmodium knowlesi TaxID=5850 RepID=A0A5K1UE12_PLAKH|nr:LisH domain-containing protein, putative [Plasmodium knowlesi strain H]OTN64251.1 Uncharacterized protein PKNOH_S140220700 [Plasmodium knowlesi]CAA9990635.1 LisH domain-containing protein, putative [Plasmodium knowlesi strain H]SBO26016.1 conserved Plasmodium protein, unknown function [Plasmodium knowlesi strain H]SBO28723.1 conserved Plasmodium protein, unknown function [Plasmodium knowlesi strain H]VVS80109.1 LisH domain-containing protein, putative [Plasmodium knowlesi strain H]|eukprot:XP_002261926.1 hypothetical protein, conserved in Plasmodium species [Plasmodium knowlesi strain H]